MQNHAAAKLMRLKKRLQLMELTQKFGEHPAGPVWAFPTGQGASWYITSNQNVTLNTKFDFVPAPQAHIIQKPAADQAAAA